MNKQIIVRHDDFDFRMTPDQYIAIHEQFIQKGLIETAVFQFTQWGNIRPIPEELITYMTTAPNWDFAIHGWEHAEYDKMKADDIVRDLAASSFFIQKFFHKTPTTWFPPWNRFGPEMEKAAEYVGLTISNESYDISRFVREVEKKEYAGHSLYFHGYKWQEMEEFPKMLELVKRLSEEGYE